LIWIFVAKISYQSVIAQVLYAGHEELNLQLGLLGQTIVRKKK
jgi:hypothetical protein